MVKSFSVAWLLKRDHRASAARHFALLFSGLALTATADLSLAQDGTEVTLARTPANAQKFIKQNPPDQYSLLLEDRYVDTFVREGELSAPDACTTAFNGRMIESYGLKHHVVMPKPTEETRSIAWGKVAGVWKFDGAFAEVVVTMTRGSEPTQYTLSYATRDIGIRDRVLAAAQYLQKACDHTENLGF